MIPKKVNSVQPPGDGGTTFVTTAAVVKKGPNMKKTKRKRVPVHGIVKEPKVNLVVVIYI